MDRIGLGFPTENEALKNPYSSYWLVPVHIMGKKVRCRTPEQNCKYNPLYSPIICIHDSGIWHGSDDWNCLQKNAQPCGSSQIWLWYRTTRGLPTRFTPQKWPPSPVVNICFFLNPVTQYLVKHLHVKPSIVSMKPYSIYSYIGYL